MDESGSVFAEYVVLLSLVSLTCAAAAALLGPPLAALYRVQVAALLFPLL